MKGKKSSVISEIEWKIMRILWEKGILSVKEVWTKIYPDGEKAYTTIQTYMDRMVEKKLLKKNKIGLVNFYHPLVDENTMKKQATENLVSRVFNGSFGSLAAFLVDSYNISTDDLGKIRKMIDTKEDK